MFRSEDENPEDPAAPTAFASVIGLVVGTLAGIAIWLVLAAVFTDLI